MMPSPFEDQPKRPHFILSNKRKNTGRNMTLIWAGNGYKLQLTPITQPWLCRTKIDLPGFAPASTVILPS